MSLVLIFLLFGVSSLNAMQSQYIEPQFVRYSQNIQRYCWLFVPESDDYVLVRLNAGAGKPLILRNNVKTYNFKYVYANENGDWVLPKGLFYWYSHRSATVGQIVQAINKQINQNVPHNYPIFMADPKKKTFKFAMGNHGKYVGITNRKPEAVWDESRGYVHPSKSLFGFKGQASGSGTLPGAIARASIFEHVMGETEGAFAIKIASGNRPNFPTHKFDPGTFKQYSIKELRDRCKGKQPFNQKGYFNILTFDIEKGDNTRKFVDIGAMQAMPENKDAIFLVASRFHCLEGDSDRKWYLRFPQNKGGMLNNIIDKKAAQGEEAGISAMPGTIWRMYYYKNPIKNPTDTHEVNLLSNLGFVLSDLPDRSHGMPKPSSSTNIAAINKIYHDTVNGSNDAQIDEIRKRVKIGWHEGVQIVTGYANVNFMKGGDRSKNKKDSNVVVKDPNQKINQVLAAAFDFNTGHHGNYFSQHNPANVVCGQLLLDAAFEGALRAAVAFGKQRVVLTLIGAGAFKNKTEWVLASIDRMKKFIKKYNLQVSVVYYYIGAPNKQTLDGLRSISEHVGGKLVSYSATVNQEVVPQKHKPQTQTIGSIKKLHDSLLFLKKKISSLVGTFQGLVST